MAEARQWRVHGYGNALLLLRYCSRDIRLTVSTRALVRTTEVSLPKPAHSCAHLATQRTAPETDRLAELFFGE